MLSTVNLDLYTDSNMDIDDNDDPYESLPCGRNTPTYLYAGAAAGILEHCVMYPVDVVRTRMQSIRPPIEHKGFVRTFKYMIKTEKFKTFRGMAAVVTGAGPAHALYFALYETLKQNIPNYIDPHHNTPLGPSRRALTHGVAGCFATVAHDAIMVPVDVVKQRMQMYKSPFTTSLSCATHIFKKEGLKAFYRSYGTQLTMNLPYQAIHFVTYEFMQDVTNRDRIYNPTAHMISGAVAGALASAVTTPLDVCKTLLNTQEKLALLEANSERVANFKQAARLVYKCCGIGGYTQGLLARMLVASPATAISWSVYEFFKNYYINS